MARSQSFQVIAGAIAVLIFAAGQAHANSKCTPGAAGVGDTYYPGYGNGGYDVKHYDLDLAYDPETDVLEGRAAIKARATQDLCSFNLDFVGLEVRAIRVYGQPASWSRSGQELTVDPRRPEGGAQVQGQGVVRRRSGRVHGGVERLMATPEGLTVAGQTEVATAWFPVNDHPRDKASYSFEVSVPDGYEVAANGLLRDVDRGAGMTTWSGLGGPGADGVVSGDDRRRPIGTSHRWRTNDGIRVYDAVSSQIHRRAQG